MNPHLQAYVLSLIPNEGERTQREVAKDIECFVSDQLRDMGLLIEQVGAADDAVCQRNDARRKELVA